MISLISIPYDEFRVWKQVFVPEFSALNETAEEILEYAITEVLNNARDHSGGETVTLSLSQDERNVEITIADDGKGIFRHIMDHLHIEEPLDAAIELVKGKLTTQPERHTGEGLFFTAQAVQRIQICANAHCLELATSQATFTTADDFPGTRVTVQLDKRTERPLKAVFDTYCHAGEDEIPVFDTTLFRLQLAQSEGRLISRSQAKRIMFGMERFVTVEVDFTGVERIGQAFADEMFRVWPAFHKTTIVTPVNAGEEAKNLIARVTRQR